MVALGLDTAMAPVPELGHGQAAGAPLPPPLGSVAWYFARGQKQEGPVAEGEIRRLLAQGSIDTRTLVWREGMANWQPLADLPEFGGAA